MTCFFSLRYQPKDFRQRRPDGTGGYIWNLDGERKLLYRLQNLSGHSSAFVPEGEKDVDRLLSLGVAATCNSGGAGQWQAEHTQQMRAAGVQEIFIIPDNDEPGHKHAQSIARSCFEAGLFVKIVPLPGLPSKGDVSVFLDAGNSIDDLKTLCVAIPPWNVEDIDSGEPSTGGLGTNDFSPLPVSEWIVAGDESNRIWVLEDYLPQGGLVALAGKPKEGKTTLAYELCAKVAQGAPFLGRRTNIGNVLIVAVEEHKRDVQHRLRELGVDQLHNLYVHVGPLQDSPQFYFQLAKFIQASRITLLLLDTLSSFWAVQDENNAVEVTRAIKPLLGLARRTGACVFLIHHARKSEGEYGDVIRGSGALYAAC